MTPLFTAFALAAFAANSILCRLALGRGAIDAASFTAVRLASGAAALLVIVKILPRPKSSGSQGRSWTSALLLFLYAMPFSLAYVSLGVATGALILFLSVQATMLVGAIRAGERIGVAEGVGLFVAIAGLVVLVSPGLSAPEPVGALLMALAGMAWGIYSLRGRSSSDPIGDTAANFIRSVPFAGVAVLAAAMGSHHVSGRGALLAACSGIVASGLGYAAWFAALRKLKALQAAALQLTVPVIAAAGGILLLSERASVRLLVSTALILGGVGLALKGRASRARAAAGSARGGASPGTS
ncbi:MAG TPA: DMT family transporter [Candidatus Limnocylindrales bacterium]|nr:DMT family transporter [Candidatus Limnocylindrales bacterium]